MDIRHAGFDRPAKLELASTLRDLDRPDFARPFIDILKEMPVNGAQMCEVEIAQRNAAGGARDGEFALMEFQRRLVGYSQLIPENS
jgi:hypothetical protein